MGFDFTVAIIPDTTSIDRELNYLKSSVLYADKVTLISPLAYLIEKLIYARPKNEKECLNLLYQVLPLAKQSDYEFYNSAVQTIRELESIIRSRKYKAVPVRQKLELKKNLTTFAEEVSRSITDLIGAKQVNELESMIQSGQVIINEFQTSFDDLDGLVFEYFDMLRVSLRNTYPLFDEQSSNLMKAAVTSRVIHLSDIDRKKITHAGLTDNCLQKLPSFSEATANELIDIKKELSIPLIRFRSKMICYSETIQSMPWDDDFETECQILYSKEIAPSLLEIEEMTNDETFKKNLGKKFFTDTGTWKSAGSLVVGIAAGGVISAFNDVISTQAATLASVGGAYVIPKIAESYIEYRENLKDIEKKDLYFYYKAGKILEK